MAPSAPWYTTLSLGKERNLFVGCSSSQTEHTSIEFNGHSFLGCLLVHLGQKIAKAISASSCFLLICKVSICMVRVWSISLLKSSSMFPNSPLRDELDEEVLAMG